MENILSLDERINSTAQDHNTAPKYVQTTTGQGKLESPGWTMGVDNQFLKEENEFLFNS